MAKEAEYHNQSGPSTFVSVKTGLTQVAVPPSVGTMWTSTVAATLGHLFIQTPGGALDLDAPNPVTKLPMKRYGTPPIVTVTDPLACGSWRGLLVNGILQDHGA